VATRRLIASAASHELPILPLVLYYKFQLLQYVIEDLNAKCLLFDFVTLTKSMFPSGHIVNITMRVILDITTTESHPRLTSRIDRHRPFNAREAMDYLREEALFYLENALSTNHHVAIITNGTGYRVSDILEVAGLSKEEIKRIEICSAESILNIVRNHKYNAVEKLALGKI